MIRMQQQQIKSLEKEKTQLKEQIDEQGRLLANFETEQKVTSQFRVDAKHTIKALASSIDYAICRLQEGKHGDFEHLAISAEFIKECGLKEIKVQKRSEYIKRYRAHIGNIRQATFKFLPGETP